MQCMITALHIKYSGEGKRRGGQLRGEGNKIEEGAVAKER